MDSKLTVSVSPHIYKNITTKKIMLDVVISLLPASVAGVIIFGLSAVWVLLTCIIASVLSEYVFNLIVKKEQTLYDLTAVVTGLLLGLNLPANTPLWQCVIGSVFAIIIVKCVFGGVGCNLVNPAITARVFMLVAFTNLAVPAFPKSVDAVSSATALPLISQGERPSLINLFLGNIGGAIGETSKLALLIGGIYLLLKRVITWHIPTSFIASVFVFSLILEDFDFYTALAWTLSGGLIIGAFFMATDYVTSPSNPKGKIVYGIGCGVITVLIRFYGNYPEGVSFAILMMNIVNPYIESAFRRRLFGGKHK